MAEDPRTVRQLGHDLRNHLFVLSLGLQTLELGGEPRQLGELVSTLREEVTAAERIADALQRIDPDSPEP